MTKHVEGWWTIPLWKWRNDRSQTNTKSEIDYQRERVYRAEDASGIKHAPQLQFLNIAECQEYVNKVCNNWHFKYKVGEFHALIVPRTHGAALGARRSPTIGRIYLPRWAYSEWVILHELAHCVTPAAAGGAHGRRWCRMYMDLVERHMGDKWSTALRQSFLKFGVKTSPRRPPSVISDKCAAMRDKFYIKPKYPKIEAAPDTFPESIAELCSWVESEMEWPAGSIKMERLLVENIFRVNSSPGRDRPFIVGVSRLCDLTYGEWTAEFRKATHG